MIFQQRIRLTAQPIERQDVNTSIVSTISRFFLDRADRFNTSSARIQRIEYENEVLDGDTTYVDMIATVDASTVEFFDLFLKSFLRRDDTFSFVLVAHDYHGM